jgi:hypothetical protein
MADRAFRGREFTVLNRKPKGAKKAAPPEFWTVLLILYIHYLASLQLGAYALFYRNIDGRRSVASKFGPHRGVPRGLKIVPCHLNRHGFVDVFGCANVEPRETTTYATGACGGTRKIWYVFGFREPGFSGDHRPSRGLRRSTRFSRARTDRGKRTAILSGPALLAGHLMLSAPEGTRTPDPLFRRQMLYPLSYGRVR